MPLAPAAGGPSPHTRRPAPAAQEQASASISAFDLIELQIAYTTLLAVYYRPLSPRTLVDGARTGIGAELLAHGVRDVALPYTPTRVDRGRGSDLIDGLVLRSLARAGMRLDGHRLVAAAVAGELAALHDPYTVAFRPQQFGRFNAFLGNETFGGIGAVVSYDAPSGRARIERVLPDGPALAAGLRDGDAVVAIDGRSVADIGGARLRDALRGRIGSTVRLEVARGDERRSLTVVRAKLRDPEVRSALLGEAGYLALSRFGDRAGAELAAALADLRRRGATAFVLDLRGNGGGYGDEATAVAALFLAGPVFVTRDRSGTPKVARATMAAPFPERLAVLVDGDTASAAEIVAGALQDAGKATIVGQRTFGKGLVQSIFPLPDGSALKITTARYTTPKGRDIDRVGIVPDVAVPGRPGAGRGDPASDAQLAAALAAVHAAPAAASSAAPEPPPVSPMPATMPSASPSPAAAVLPSVWYTRGSWTASFRR